MLDKLLAVLSLLLLIGFCGIIVWFVPEIDLAIVTCVVLAMACFDFYRTVVRRNGNGT